jgi:hypothetical protein
LRYFESVLLARMKDARLASPNDLGDPRETMEGRRIQDSITVLLKF